MGTGWKTYLSGALSIVWGIGGLYLGIHGPDVAIGFVVSGLGLIGLRHKLESIGVPQNVIDKITELEKRAPVSK